MAVIPLLTLTLTTCLMLSSQTSCCLMTKMLHPCQPWQLWQSIL
jgi:hypothetical protein